MVPELIKYHDLQPIASELLGKASCALPGMVFWV